MAYCEFKKDDVISFDMVKAIWKENTRPVVLYLNTPFCAGGPDGRNCRYCVHRGWPHPHDEEVVNFYNYHLPHLLKMYSPIIEKADIKLIDFGGGTPSFPFAITGNADAYRKFLEFIEPYIPNFRKIHKLIELHPAYISCEFLDVLKEFGFTTVTFCVQTFDSDMLLNEWNRYPCDPLELLLLRDHAEDIGLNVAFDFITYWHGKVTEDTDILDEDLQKLKEFRPDEFTVSVMCQYKYGSGRDMNPLYDRIRYVIEKNFPDYENPENSLYIPEVTAMRMYKPGKNGAREDFEIYRNSMSDVGWSYECGYSTIGLGCYKNQDKAVFSIIGPKYTIYEEFNGFGKDPIFHLSKNYDFWKAAHNVLDALELEYNGKEVPVGTILTLTNICQNQNLGYSHFGQGNCDYNLREPNDIPTYDMSGEMYYKMASPEIKARVNSYGNKNRKEQH